MDISYCDDKTGFPRPGHNCWITVNACTHEFMCIIYFSFTDPSFIQPLSPNPVMVKYF